MYPIFDQYFALACHYSVESPSLKTESHSIPIIYHTIWDNYNISPYENGHLRIIFPNPNHHPWVNWSNGVFGEIHGQSKRLMVEHRWWSNTPFRWLNPLKYSHPPDIKKPRKPCCFSGIDSYLGPSRGCWMWTGGWDYCCLKSTNNH